MLFMLIKTLARNEEKWKQEQEMRNMRYACGLRVQESIGIWSVNSSCRNWRIILTFCRPSRMALTDNMMW